MFITQANRTRVSGCEENDKEEAYIFITTVSSITGLVDKCFNNIKLRVLGSRYDGSWENDRITGEGTSWYPNGLCEMSLLLLLMTQPSVWLYLNPLGNKYTGEWLNGRINGRGVLFLANNDRYSGDWKDGKRHGAGAYFYA